jgi:hypothetical protein
VASAEVQEAHAHVCVLLARQPLSGSWGRGPQTILWVGALLQEQGALGQLSSLVGMWQPIQRGQAHCVRVAPHPLLCGAAGSLNRGWSGGVVGLVVPLRRGELLPQARAVLWGSGVCRYFLCGWSDMLARASFFYRPFRTEGPTQHDGRCAGRVERAVGVVVLTRGRCVQHTRCCVHSGVAGHGVWSADGCSCAWRPLGVAEVARQQPTLRSRARRGCLLAAQAGRLSSVCLCD